MLYSHLFSRIEPFLAWIFILIKYNCYPTSVGMIQHIKATSTQRRSSDIRHYFCLLEVFNVSLRFTIKRLSNVSWQYYDPIINNEGR